MQELVQRYRRERIAVELVIMTILALKRKVTKHRALWNIITALKVATESVI